MVGRCFPYEYGGVHTSSIVLMVEPGEQVHHGLNKALLLARHLREPLDLFWCGGGSDVPHQKGWKRDETALADSEAQNYLRALRLGIPSADVVIRSECTRAPSLAEGLMQKLQHTPARLVVRAVANNGGSKTAAKAIDQSLLQGCSSPLLLARKRAWRPIPRFAAALDLNEESDKDQCQQIARLAEALTSACGALLEYLFIERDDRRARGAVDARHRLDALTRPDRVSGWLHYRVGDPKELLPRVVVERDYDLLLLGLSVYPPHNVAGDALRGSRADGSTPWARKEMILDTLPARLLRSAGGDLLLVPKIERVAVER